jgi:3-oxoacyl-[acyl-carrier protein] reductase
MMGAVRDRFGGLDFLVNNAAIIRDRSIAKMSEEEWQQVIDVNLSGVFYGTRAFAKHHVETKAGQEAVIVSISSISRAGNQGQSNYSAAKAGLVSMTKLWGGELARYGIRTGAIAPGFTRTPILEGMPPEALAKVSAPVPLKRIGEPEEMYLTVKFIIENDYFTGRVIDVDGGLRLS